MGAGIPQTTVSSCTPTATGRSIAKRWMWHHRVPQGAFERLELLEGKLSRAVLRGLGGSNPARLPGAPGNRCLYPEGDALQRPLRSRFRVRLRPSVNMTSDIKGWEQLFYVCLIL